MQLVAYGAQDVYLTGNSQVTFWKQLYKRHTNFSMQSVEAGFNGSVGFGKRVALVVPRVGDLMGRVYLEASLPAWTAKSALDGWVKEVGHFLINNIEVQIGGQIIDKHYGTWLSIWSNLTLPTGKNQGYQQMIGITELKANQPAQELYIPLQFWFCRHEGLNKLNSPSDSQNLLLVIDFCVIYFIFCIIWVFIIQINFINQINYTNQLQHILMRETPKVLTTTSIGKPLEGPHVIHVLS